MKKTIHISISSIIALTVAAILLRLPFAPVDISNVLPDIQKVADTQNATNTQKVSDTPKVSGIQKLFGTKVKNQTASVLDVLNASPELVAWYKFDETSGTAVADASGHNNSGTATGTGITWSASGNDAGAISFAGNGGYVIVPANLNATPVTYAIWFKTTAGGNLLSDSNQSKDSGTEPTTFSPFLIVRSDGYLGGGWNNGNSYPMRQITSTTRVNDGDWHLGVVSNDGTTQKLYLDGALVGEEAAGTLATGYLQVGNGNSAHWDGGYYGWWAYTGLADNLRIFNRALSDSEANALYSDQFLETATAVSCAEADVESAMNTVAVGGTLIIPAGTCTWTYPLHITRPMTIQGSGIDTTNIIDALDVSSTLTSHAVFNLSTPSGALTRLTNLTITANGTTDLYNKGIIKVEVDGSDWRVDHIKVVNSAGAVFEIYSSGGVIDHNTFDVTGAHQVIRSFNGVGAATGGDFYGDVAWSQGLNLGTRDNFFFVEDNTFNQLDPSHYISSASDGETGQRVVFRHNTLNNMSWNNHGLDSSGVLRGSRSFEIYKNIFNYVTTSAPGAANGVSLRSGNGVIWGNQFNGEGVTPVPLYTDNYRDWADFAPWGACDGTSPYDINDNVIYRTGTASIASAVSGGYITFTDSTASWTPHQWIGYSLHNTTLGGAGSVIVENTETTITLKNVDADSNSGTHRTGGAIRWSQGDGYKILRATSCLDQTGRGHGTLFTRNGQSIPTNPVSSQISEPTYLWDNTKNGVAVGMQSASPHSIENRDFYNSSCPAGYTPYTYPHPLTGLTAQSQSLNCDGSDPLPEAPPEVIIPAQDTTAPTISSISAGSITTSGAVISWTTNEAASSLVEYGLTTSYGNSAGSSSALVTSHEATMSGLSASTVYHYRITSTDSDANSAVSADQTFTTSAAVVQSSGGSSGGGGGGGGSSSSGGGSSGNTTSVTTRTVATSSVSTSTKAVTTTVITTPTKVTISPIPAQYINLPKYTRSADNVILQNALIARGYLAPGLNTGYYGEMTAIAVVKYKQSLGSSASNTITQPPVQTATVSKTPSKTVVIPTSYEKIPLYSRGAAVTELQKLLVSAGYLNAAYVTGYYGQLTKAAFDAYKAKANTTSVAPTISPKTTTTKTVATTTTKTSPIVVPKAVTATTTVFTRTMSEGSTGADVLALKTFLNTRGFTVTSSGNTYDAATTKAVAQFQRVYSAVLSDPSGIVGESGTVGVATLKLINQINAKK